MVSITLSVPQEMKREMDAFRDINWSAVARQAIERKLLLLEKFRQFTKDSQLTQDDAVAMGSQVSKKALARYRKK